MSSKLYTSVNNGKEEQWWNTTMMINTQWNRMCLECWGRHILCETLADSQSNLEYVLRKKWCYRQNGGMYGGLLKQNVSRVLRQTSSVRGCSYKLSMWYSTLVILSRSSLITFPHLSSHAGLSLLDPYLMFHSVLRCSIRIVCTC